MAQNAPPSQDVQDIQFKLHDKLTIFIEGNAKSLVSLLAVSSTKGLLFAGNPSVNELKVFKLEDVISKSTGQNVKVRIINLPGEPKVLSCSCDGSMLAVNYVLNNTGFLLIYYVESFVTPSVKSLYNIPIAPENNAFALQLLWNPVIPNNIAIILTVGSVVILTLNNGGQYDKVTLGKEHQVKTGCWSPKGKQIVFGFPEGKLQQFKPNLQPARAISCPPGIHPGPFDCIAVHWLSTFQFAAIFLQRGQEMCPSLFIINAPKAGQPMYINYYDICYSNPGPRIQQLSFHHIAQWNILLVTSANGVEVGVLATKESGETPMWIQYTLLDEARIEMPLTELKEETYPLGFAFDTALLHRVTIGEKTLSAMPMIHILSTHGHLVSYNFLNLSPKAVDICSPPTPLNDLSDEFVSLSNILRVNTSTSHVRPTVTTNELEALNKPQNAGQGCENITFTLGSNMVTSTPSIKEKSLAGFGSQVAVAKSTTSLGFPTTTSATTATAKSSAGFGVGSGTSNATTFCGMTTGSSFRGISGTEKPNEKGNTPSAQQIDSQSPNIYKGIEVNKPLYTVPPTFIPPNMLQQQSVNKSESNPIKSTVSSNKINLNTVEIDEVVKQMIVVQIEAFEMEMRQIRHQSMQLIKNIGPPEALKSYTKQLHDLQEIVKQANDNEYEQEIQSLRHSMNESYAMLAECRTKLDTYNNPDLPRLSAISSTDSTNRRQLAKLQAYVVSNQNQLSILNQLIDAQWSQYQDVVRRNSKNQMHVPCLDGIYQRMSKLKDLLSKQRIKMNYIKTKLKQKGLNYKPANDVNITSAAAGALIKNKSTMESLADSILSMSLSQVVSQTNAKLSEEKLNAIRNFAKRQQQVAIIKPKRPDRVGLKSEVILETKLETERKQNEISKKHQQLQQQWQLNQYPQQIQFPDQNSSINNQSSSINLMREQLLKSKTPLFLVQQQNQRMLPKPTASKPSVVSSQFLNLITLNPTPASAVLFGGNSSFVKTSVSGQKSEEITKPLTTTTAPFAGFGVSISQADLNFNQPKPILNTAVSLDHDTKENKTTSTPISFAAKVIGGNDTKSFANLNNKTIPQTNMMPPTSQGLGTCTSAFATTKPAEQASTQDKDSAKNPEETSKQFSSLTSLAVASSTPADVEGIPASTNTSLFASYTMTSTLTPLNATVTSSTTLVPTSTKNISTKAVTITTSSLQPAAVVTAKPTETKISTISTSTANIPTASKSTSFSFDSQDAANISLNKMKSSAEPTVAITEVKSVAMTPTSSNTQSATTKEHPIDSLLDCSNICKPTIKDSGDSCKAGNIFSGFAASTSALSPGSFSFATASGAGDGAKSFISSNSAAGFSFVGAATTTSTTTTNIFEKTLKTETSIANSTTGNTNTTSALSVNEISNATVTAPTADSLFGALSISSLNVASTANTATTSGNIFSESSVFGKATTAVTSSTTTSVFAGNATVVSTAPSLFGSATSSGNTAPTPSAGSTFGNQSAATLGTGSIFSSSSPTTTSTGSIFGGKPQPEQSVFVGTNNTGQPTGTGLFATASANSKSTVTTGGNIFSKGTSAGFGASTGDSIFGGGNATASSTFGATSPTTGSIFGTATNKEGGSIFGSPTQQSPSSGGSIFGKSTFGTTAGQQSAGNIFGGGNAQSPSSGGFGATGGSIFGSSTSANRPTSGGSLFGSTAPATTSAFGTSTSPGFGAFSQPTTAPAFGSPSAGAFGTPAPAGFGSQPQQSAFAKPVFGGPATFGSPQPAFGAQPTFGGTTVFGSPKGFGSFSATSPTASGFGTATQGAAVSKGNIFETLGSQDTGLTFGNLAHSTQAPQSKPAFGGSSFMNYRS